MSISGAVPGWNTLMKPYRQILLFTFGPQRVVGRIVPVALSHWIGSNKDTLESELLLYPSHFLYRGVDILHGNIPAPYRRSGAYEQNSPNQLL